MPGLEGEGKGNRRRGGEGEGQAQERNREDTRQRRGTVTETVRACLFCLWKGREGPGRRVAELLPLPT